MCRNCMEKSIGSSRSMYLLPGNPSSHAVEPYRDSGEARCAKSLHPAVPPITAVSDRQARSCKRPDETTGRGGGRPSRPYTQSTDHRPGSTTSHPYRAAIADLCDLPVRFPHPTTTGACAALSKRRERRTCAAPPRRRSIPDLRRGVSRLAWSRCKFRGHVVR